MDPGSPSIVIGLSLIASEVFVAMFTNIFIISAVLLHFYRKNRIDPKDKIQLALKVSGFIFTTLVTHNEFSKILQPHLPKMSHPSPLFGVVFVYCMCSSSWLVALQCFFYFIKIVHFQWAFISWVKMRIGSIVSWHIVVVEVVSVWMSLLQLLPYRTAHISPTNSSYISSTFTTPEQMIVYDSVTYFLLNVICASLVLTIIATFITAAFLRCHMKKMKDTNTTGELHQYNHAVQTLLRFLLLFSMFYVVIILYYFSVFLIYSIGYWINLLLVFSFMPAVNILQILGNSNLRKTWKEMTSYFTLCRAEV